MSEGNAAVDEARRYGGIVRLYGAEGLARLRAARVAVAGIGGVGSWVVEALARSGVGSLRLIDLDHVAESNMNRQIHALEATLGQAKVLAMAERIAGIDPRTVVETVDDFVTEDNVAQVLAAPLDYVVDAIDDVRGKAAMVAWCRRQGVPVITLGAAGGQVDPTRIEIADLARTTQDPLLAKLRARLRRDYGFPRGAGKRFRVDAVYSTEPLHYPEAACETDAGPQGLSCAGFGSSMAVTASFGLAAAARVLEALARPAA
ncbi:tRNA threonylcarbamoyladenosine dehydratase [Nitrogeniibacter mangrovi]|uniref:tRNA threonylcarbamoyladenosine dehydratase n=1 Tax=Nitrogeniibacter mangrovi TaxID=2016596 RepID=A0A6C1B5N5_9RHOO|nr:tRNA threonylcarbamoyladenosine dehydratase [Nitrogeniibacter mangrovi]QID19022.1 tRNA threonylcarbamoyladenosine dehydratase [Nitrogeniibacter mangrovi]